MPESQVFNNSFVKIESGNMTPLHHPSNKSIILEDKHLDEFSTNRNVDQLRDEMIKQLDACNDQNEDCDDLFLPQNI